MMFKDIDEWMLSIELKKVPSARERRQHMKLERIRDESYENYLKRFRKVRGPYDVPSMKYCADRFKTPFERQFDKMWKSYRIAIGMDQPQKPDDYN